MAKFNDIQQKLGRAGIPANTVKISGYDNKEISLEKRTNKRKDIQVVSHDIEVETRDLKNLGNIISVANALGIGTNGSIEYDIDNKQQLENELYENAYKEALKKAQVILGKTDLNLKNPVTITDKSNGVIHPYRDYNYSYNMSANYDEEDFLQVVILHAYFNLNLTEKSFLEIWNKYQQGEYNDLLEEDEEDFENDLDWGD